MRQIAFGTFDNFNTVVAGVKGSIAAGIELFTETLMTPALDEVSTEYGLLAEAVSYPDDHSSVTYRLRAKAQWHDGKPVTPEDVIFSFDAFKNNSPHLGAYYRHVTKAEKTGEREVTFTFDGPGNRELPQIVGQLPVLPKHWWEGTDQSGNKRDVTADHARAAARLRALPAQGIRARPHARLREGRRLLGQGSQRQRRHATISQQIRYEYFRDSTVALEAFKGDQVDWRTENSAKNWATAYDFPAVRDKRVVLEEFPIRNVGVMQAFAFNIRRRQVQGSARAPRLQLRVRFRGDEPADFLRPVQAHRQLFRRHRARIDRACRKARSSRFWRRCATRCRPICSRKPYTNPVGGNPQAMRDNLREALALFREAGYEIQEHQAGQRQDRRAVQRRIPGRRSGDRALRAVLQAVARAARHRQSVCASVDAAQYENRLRQWDFDIIVASWGQSLSPGNEQRGFWGSQAADQPGSRNLVGIKNPAVDHADRPRHLRQGPR